MSDSSRGAGTCLASTWRRNSWGDDVIRCIEPEHVIDIEECTVQNFFGDADRLNHLAVA